MRRECHTFAIKMPYGVTPPYTPLNIGGPECPIILSNTFFYLLYVNILLIKDIWMRGVGGGI